MRNLLMAVSYDGTNYYGFQTQPGGNTVQDHLEAAIFGLTGERVKIHGSGRTDAGVHARQQPFNFPTAAKIPVERWCLALNSRLPSDIRVTSAREVPLSFHSRRSAKRKTYRYTINGNRFPDVFQRNYQLHHYGRLDIEAMRLGLAFWSVRMITPPSPHAIPPNPVMFARFMMPGWKQRHRRMLPAVMGRALSTCILPVTAFCSTWFASL
ncbi:hypothetical protein HMSSN036_36830 [Paenibacillus macerans]|nr:hypothetical protein HMSSN036_36830 [Paenibacillus macerans]